MLGEYSEEKRAPSMEDDTYAFRTQDKWEGLCLTKLYIWNWTESTKLYTWDWVVHLPCIWLT